jgi:hypothetical protein
VLFVCVESNGAGGEIWTVFTCAQLLFDPTLLLWKKGALLPLGAVFDERGSGMLLRMLDRSRTRLAEAQRLKRNQLRSRGIQRISGLLSCRCPKLLT